MTKEQSSGASKMLDTTREAVELLAIMWSKRGYVSPPRDPQDYVATASCAEAIETADTLRALIARAETAEARIRELEGQLDVERSTYEDVLRDSKRKADRIDKLEAENAALRKGPGVTATPLDLSNLLKHAFVGGRVTAGGPHSLDAENWVEYDPTACAAYGRILSALTLAPVSVGEAARFAETHERITQDELQAVFGDRFSMRFVEILLQEFDDGPIGARRALNRALADKEKNDL